jgi:hypothetical protein
MPERVELRTPVLFQRLAPARRVLVAGAGGGFDVFAGLPIALSLLDQGKEVAFGNLTFTYLGGTDAAWLAPNVAMVTARCSGEDRYFPERSLARYLASRGITAPIYAFEKVGARPLGAAYAAVCEHFSPDAIVLVDGGTDILMFGDEAGLGTPQEDMVSLAAVASLADIPERLVACIGFGIDAYHGVCHAHFLENVATLDRDGAYLGAFSVPRVSEEGRAFLDAIGATQAETPRRSSIVNGSIAAAIRGEFGDVQFTERTRGSELFVNPLMALYFTFDLVGLAARSLYLKSLRHTETIFEVGAIIEAFRHAVVQRPRRAIPH